MDSDSDIDGSECGETSLSLTIKKAKEAVCEICRHIREEFKGFNIHNIHKVGSLGSGTVVLGSYNIDLVIYSKSFTGERVSPPDMFKPWLLQLKKFIEKHPNVKSLGRNDKNYSIEFRYETEEETEEIVSIGVELFVSPDWDKPSDFYDFLKKIPRRNRMHYNCFASKWQKSFLKDRLQIVKEYVRRAKAWRNKVWGQDTEGKPNSYLIQLLVIKAYQCACIRRRDNKRERAERVTQALIKLVKKEKLNVYWADKLCYFYWRRDYIALLPSRPRVIDPANPANNVWKTGFKNKDPSRLIEMIDSIDLTKAVEHL